MIPLKLPPGIVRPGTVYDAQGRWYKAQLIRWVEGVMQAWGGWQLLATVDSAVRGLFAWRNNGGFTQLAIGTTAKLWVWIDGLLTDITPADFKPGMDSSGSYGVGAYGAGRYGAGPYGTGEGGAVLAEAQSWQMDSWGEDLVACAYSDGRILYWKAGDTTPAVPLENAPENNAGVVVSPERFVVALAAGGDGRLVQWSDQEDARFWDKTDATKQAGDFPLDGEGRIVAGRRGRGETLIWTETSLWRMSYIGGPLVFGFHELANKCGPASRRSMVVVDGRAFWMGRGSFFGYEGYVKPLPCDVADAVFSDLDASQLSKVAADVRSDFGEVLWYYPSVSGGTGECDSYVAYNYRADHWTMGRLKRTAGFDRGALALAIAGDAGGRVYEHEVGTSRLDGATELVPYAESGPVELGAGDSVLYASRVRPDEKTLGGVKLTLYGAMDPTSAETTYGPYTMTQPVYLRFCARQLRLRVDEVTAGWRWGTPRLDLIPGGER